MEVNTFIRFSNDNPKRVKEHINTISSGISTNNFNGFPFIEVTEIVGYTSGAEFEEKTDYFENETIKNKILLNDFHKLETTNTKPKGKSNLKDW